MTGSNDTMDKDNNLTNHFLIAMPGLRDPNFSRSVSYICEHSDQGAMGIIVNKPSELVLGEILDQLSITAASKDIYDHPVYLGGPVQSERGFVLHNDNSVWDSTLAVTEQISVTTSKDILEAMAKNKGPDKTLMALGYAGWEGGQLEHELSENSWLSGPADSDIIFALPSDQRLSAAAQQLGVDLNLISLEPGHA